jgi:hypothetical protein
LENSFSFQDQGRQETKGIEDGADGRKQTTSGCGTFHHFVPELQGVGFDAPLYTQSSFDWKFLAGQVEVFNTARSFFGWKRLQDLFAVRYKFMQVESSSFAQTLRFRYQINGFVRGWD